MVGVDNREMAVVCLSRFFDALEVGDRVEAEEAREDLSRWLADAYAVGVSPSVESGIAIR